jgi:hypothetical protein
MFFSFSILTRIGAPCCEKCVNGAAFLLTVHLEPLEIRRSYLPLMTVNVDQ